MLPRVPGPLPRIGGGHWPQRQLGRQRAGHLPTTARPKAMRDQPWPPANAIVGDLEDGSSPQTTEANTDVVSPYFQRRERNWPAGSAKDEQHFKQLLRKAI
ncbi:hypothetical protein G7Z17_g629 [Cylindrodendrum hubeiense]|uniref:Uncharacterized protein n=1 Tax=Cylindrodendrum hubeiense TaxID=595255 RepID=A0A9P5HMB6_9HYPO|nr:hypothetical protein G7Z17_g629 [Cylindrodendrum hubeiense]